MTEGYRGICTDPGVQKCWSRKQEQLETASPIQTCIGHLTFRGFLVCLFVVFCFCFKIQSLYWTGLSLSSSLFPRVLWLLNLLTKTFSFFHSTMHFRMYLLMSTQQHAPFTWWSKQKETENLLYALQKLELEARIQGTFFSVNSSIML